MRNTVLAAVVGLGCVISLAPAIADGAPKVAAPDPCAGRATVVLVRTGERRLYACRAGRTEARYRVALGSNGVGKRVQGDWKTPLGAYPLGAPRRSQSYGTFVPVGYPTAAQRRAGFTGDAIGIHGPPRGFPQSGVTTVTDWTAGCIAVGSDHEVGAIAAFVRGHAGTGVEIE